MTLSQKFCNCKQAQQKVNHCSKDKRKGEKGRVKKKFPKIKKPKDIGHFLAQNFDFCACPSHNALKHDAGGKRGKLLCCKGFFDQIKGSLAKIQPKNHQNVHFFRTFINFHLSFVLPSIERDMDIACYLLQQVKLALFRQRCGNTLELDTETSRHKPKRASEFSKELFAVDNLDVSCDDETKHPFLCRFCFMKLACYQILRSRHDSKLKFPGDKGNCQVFSSHDSYVETEGTCPFGTFARRKSPRKRVSISDPISIWHTQAVKRGVNMLGKYLLMSHHQVLLTVRI